MKHIFDVEIATQYGIHAAILLENLGFWVRHSEANNAHFHDGHYWTFNSQRAYKELFPYMSKYQIENAFHKLIDEGLVITGNYNKTALDRTLWYTLTEKGRSTLKLSEIDLSKNQNGFRKNEEPIPYINTDVNPDKDVPEPTVLGKSPRHEYGQYKNVMLTDKDMDKLKAEYPDDWQERIERLSEYMASKGTKYKNHLATIRAWARKDASKPTEKPKDDPYENYTIRW